MTLVLLGTQNNDFHRLLDEVEKNILNGNIKDEVVVQAGFTNFNSNNMKIFNMIPKDSLEKLVEKADLVISHAGVGSIEMALNKNKKIIVVPRNKKYGEHVNNHQIDTEQEFNKKGWIIGIDDVGNLANALEKSKNFVPNKYKKNDNSNMIKIVQSFIDKI